MTTSARPPKRANPRPGKYYPGDVSGYLYHFKNEKSRRAADPQFRNLSSAEMTQAVVRGDVPMSLVNRVKVLLYVHREAA